MTRYDTIFEEASRPLQTEAKKPRLHQPTKISFADFVQLVKADMMELNREAAEANDDPELDISFDPNDYDEFDEVKALDELLGVMSSYGYSGEDTLLEDFLGYFVNDVR